MAVKGANLIFRDIFDFTLALKGATKIAKTQTEQGLATTCFVDGWLVILHPLQQYFNHIRIMGG